MNKTLLILKYELITVLTRRSFLITLFIIPAISALILLVVSALGKDTRNSIGEIFSPAPQQSVEGYVDESGLIQSLPADLPRGRLIPYASQDLARQALANGKISGYYIVLKDYITTGKVYYVRADYNPLSGIEQSSIFQSVLTYNLLKGDQQLAGKLAMPLQLEQVSLAPTPQRDRNNMLSLFLPYGVTMIFYVVIMTSAGLMLNSITAEKQNRVIEILMASATPLQLLTGKIIALGIAGLLQTLIWTGAGLLLLRMGGSSLNVSAAFQLPTSILAWGAVFFILGYALYASIMAGVGALVPNLREASQATTVIIMPMVVPLALLVPLIDNPDGPLAIGLSLFPLTAPVTMMTRLSATGQVPVWQLLLAAALLLATAILCIRSVARMFRAQTLLSGQTFTLKLFLNALIKNA